MAEIDEAVATAIVKRRGATRAGIGVAVGGVAGAAVASRRTKGTTPLKDQFGFLAVLADRVVLLKAKGAFRSRPTDIVLGQGDRAFTTAQFTSNGSWGVFELSFADGILWEFDVPRAGMRDARRVADLLNQPAATVWAQDEIRP
jgi:hypothetical protein